MVLMSILGALMVLFAWFALRARRLISAALWLAGTSALLALIFYLVGARLVAVIELSVGAGLVTVLFAFAISIAGEEPGRLRSLVPPLAAGGLALGVVLVLVGLVLPTGLAPLPESGLPLSSLIWEQRGLDVLVQLVVLFSGVLGLLGLLAEVKAPLQYPVAAEHAARREQELEALQEQSGAPEPEREAYEPVRA